MLDEDYKGMINIMNVIWKN